ncbi:MAG TPA: hypothetical protein VIH91_08195 [Terriglobales bacterium]
MTEAKAASADSLFCPEIFCADRQSVVDGFHSRRRPRGNLNSMPFIPIFHKAFQKNLGAVLNRDAYLPPKTDIHRKGRHVSNVP